MAKNTRDELIEAARRQFAQKGFYGTSIASIASELGLSKQALLHHFGTKEKLYAQVLSEISDRYVARIFQVQLEFSDPRQQLEELMLDHLARQNADHNDARVVMRELLDNQSRAEQVTNWYLKPYLKALTSIVQRIPQGKELSAAEALALVYQLLGAINYLGMSEPTLTQMFGKATFEELCAAYPRQLQALIRSRFACTE